MIAGNGFQFMAGQAAGYAAADAVQALPLVSTIWGKLFSVENKSIGSGCCNSELNSGFVSWKSPVGGPQLMVGPFPNIE
jgi:hypothetical protein